MSKTKVLFIVANFYQAGAQRFTYEIDRALNKGQFEISILCVEPKSKILPDWVDQYYEEKHAELGSSIKYFDEFLSAKDLHSKVVRKLKKIIFKKMPEFIDSAKLNKYFDGYDVIHWMGEYTFYHNLSEANLEKSIIHSMSAKFQDPHLFAKFDTSKRYNFLSGFSDDECKSEYSEFKNYRHWHLPILLKIFLRENQWKFTKADTIKIGIFTRLNIYKPLDPFFYSFQLLLEKIPNCELHIYGNGDPDKEGMNQILRTLGIREKVFFRGHQQDIVNTAVNEHINLSWFQGYNNSRPAGYAGFDICTTGTPLICWDFYEYPTNPYNPVYPHFKNLNAFVAKSYEILNHPESAESLSELQFNDVCSNRDIDKFIINLEKAYLEVTADKTGKL